MCFVSEILTSIPVFQNNSLITCASWAEEESRKNLSLCTEEIGRWYGCPKRVTTNEDSPWRDSSDGFFALLEIFFGVSGWDFDLCCSLNDTVREQLSDAGYCASDHCEFNPGAYFCIRSPQLPCFEPNSEKLLYVSNQCCYNNESELIEDEEDPAVGSLDLQISSVQNMAAHYWSDLLPYKKCCADSASSDDCQVYKSHRPTVIGGYWPRNVLVNRGDPTFATVDGLYYPFMGLGVFVMIKTDHDEPSTMHVSTRRVGLGSVFSGFAAYHKTNRLQCFMSDNGTFYLKINNQNLNYNQVPNRFVLNNITTIISDDKLQLNFTFEETGLKINVQLISTFLNLIVSVPPTFKFRMAGLMGYYDGELSNDLTNSSKSFSLVSFHFKEKKRAYKILLAIYCAKLLVSKLIQFGVITSVYRYQKL